MAKSRLVGSYPVIGIRPTIDGRRGALDVRGSLEEQTMNMAKSAAKLFEENLRYSNGEPVKVVIADTTIGRVGESAAVLMLIGFLFARPLLTLFGASDDALVYAYPYLMIYLLGTLPSMIATGMNPFINAQGYAIIGMLSVTVGAVANIILDPIFIFVLDMGIKGAAIATVISQILSALLVFYFLHGKSELKVRWIHINEISECTRHARDIIVMTEI